MSVHKLWKLDSPTMCRDFLKQVHVGKEGNKIEYLEQADGKRISIDEASDKQVIEAANMIAQAVGDKK